jgi:hypothetical protein
MNTKKWELIANIKNKVSTNKLTITKADKGKTILILTQEEYENKVKKFVQDNNFTLIITTPTQHYQKTTKQTLKQCNIIIQKKLYGDIHTWTQHPQTSVPWYNYTNQIHALG